MKSRIRELLVTDYLVVDHSETRQYIEEAHGNGSWKRLMKAAHGSGPRKQTKNWFHNLSVLSSTDCAQFFEGTHLFKAFEFKGELGRTSRTTMVVLQIKAKLSELPELLHNHQTVNWTNEKEFQIRRILHKKRARSKNPRKSFRTTKF